ncbi:MAG: hypothetical protein KY475_09050 [Planctomycetes bacterium]|nr:hypothetical protein [Planctomycetota bacterium]
MRRPRPGRALSAYLAAERSRDFTAHFGDDFTMLEARLLRFYESIP